MNYRLLTKKLIPIITLGPTYQGKVCNVYPDREQRMEALSEWLLRGTTYGLLVKRQVDLLLGKLC